MCGSENPDDGSYCWKCGAELFNGAEKSSELGRVNEDGFHRKQEAVQEPPLQVAEVDHIDADGRTVLARTPERIRNRRLCIILSVVTAIVILAITFSFEIRVAESFNGLFTEYEHESFMDIAQHSPYGIGIYILIALTVITALLTLVSPRFALFSILTLAVTFVLSYIPFEYTTHFGIVYHIDPSGTSNIVLIFVVIVVILFLEVMGELFLARSVNKDGRITDHDTVIKNHGLTYNIDSEWNVVTRK